VLATEQNKAQTEAQKQWFLQNLYQWIRSGQWHSCFNCAFVRKADKAADLLDAFATPLCMKYNADPPGDVMFLGCEAWCFVSKAPF
jgi:hypothetical protein